MKSIGIGILENNENILKNIQNSKFILRLPVSLFKLQTKQISIDAMYDNREIDLYFIEKPYNLDIYLRSQFSYRIKVEYRSIPKTIFFSNLEKNLNALFYNIIEIHDFYIYIRDDSGIFKLFFSEIVYIEIEKRATVIHTISNNITTYKSLKTYMDLLDNRFVRCHSSFIVNIDYIKEISFPNIILQNNETILLSKHKRHLFLESYNMYITGPKSYKK